jgi:hypothetical protein
MQISGTLRALARKERVGGRYKGYFTGIPGKSNTTVVIKFSCDILVQKVWWREQ